MQVRACELFFSLGGVVVAIISHSHAMAQEVETELSIQQEQTPQDQPPEQAEQTFYPLEIIIRPSQPLRGEGYYSNGIIETIHGLQLRFSGQRVVGGAHKRIIDGRMVYDIWQRDRDLLTHNIMKGAGLMTLPSFEERLAHELIYGNDIGARMGGIYKNMSFEEIAYSFNLDPTPYQMGFGSKGVVGGERPFNTNYNYGDTVLGVINFGSK